MATVDERPKSGSINNLSPFLDNSRLVISRAKSGDWMTTFQAGYGFLYVFLLCGPIRRLDEVGDGRRFWDLREIRSRASSVL